MWAWDIATGQVARGGAFPELCGYALEEIPPTLEWWRERIHPDDRASVLAAFDEALAGERRELVLLYRFRHHDESHVLVLDRGFVLGTGTDVGEIIGFARQVPASTDVTHQGVPVRSENVEEERQRIARELHDEVGQLLTALRILIRSGAEGAESAEEVIDELFSRVREISSGLRPPMLDELGVPTALHWHCARFTERTGIRVHLVTPALPRRYPGAIELTAFRVIQEALTNVARHGQTKRAWVTLRTDAGQLTGMVLDRGTGFDLNASFSATSTGIAGMRQRLRETGGRLTVTSRPGQGTRVFFRLPLTPEASSPIRGVSMKNPITVVLADDHHVVREGIRSLLEREPDVQVLAEASEGLAAAELVEKLNPAVLVLDLQLPGLSGMDVLRRVSRRSPQTRVVVLSMFNTEAHLVAALKHGASAYVAKDACADDLVTAIRKAAEGERFLSVPFAGKRIEEYVGRAAGDRPDPYETLTGREREVLHLAAEGRSSAQIAERLRISPRTAETHRANALKKLDLHGQTRLVLYAVEKGLIPPAGDIVPQQA